MIVKIHDISTSLLFNVKRVQVFHTTTPGKRDACLAYLSMYNFQIFQSGPGYGRVKWLKC